MGFTSETVEPLPDNEDGLRAIVLVPVRHDADNLTDGRAYGECIALCRENEYGVDGVYPDAGPRTTFDRPTMRTAISAITRTQPDVVVIYTWGQIGKERVVREAFTSRMQDLNIRVHAVHNADAPHLDWDSDDHTRERGHRPEAE